MSCRQGFKISFPGRRSVGVSLALVCSLALTSLLVRAQQPGDEVAESSVRSADALLPIVGHRYSVSAADYSPDGTLLVTGSFDRTLKIWDLTQQPDRGAGLDLRTLAGHERQVLSVAVSPDGLAIASGSRDSTARVWDLYRPRPLATFSAYDAAVTALAAAPSTADGVPRWFLSGGADATAFLHSLPEGKVLAELSGHAGAITAAAVRGEGEQGIRGQVATGDELGVVRLWAAPLDAAEVEDAADEPADDEQRPAAGTPQGILGGPRGAVRALSYHPDGSMLLSGGADGTLTLWQLPVVAPRALAGHADAVRAVLLGGEGQADAALFLVSVGEEGTVRLLDLETGDIQLALETEAGPAGALALSPNGSVLASGSDSGLITMWGIDTEDEARVARNQGRLSGHIGPVHELAFHPAGNRVASAGGDGTVRVWRMPEAAITLAGPSPAGEDDDLDAPLVKAVAVRTDGTVIATGGDDTVVRLWNREDGSAAGVLEGHVASVKALVFRGDNGQLASGDTAGTIRLWDSVEKAGVSVLSGGSAGVTGLGYLGAGEVLISSCVDGTLRWWSLPVVSPATLPEREEAVTAVALSADGHRIVAGSADGVVQLVAVALEDGAFDVTEPLELAGQRGSVRCLAINESGSLVVSGSEAGQLGIWTIEDLTSIEGAEILAGPAAAVEGVAIHPEGTQIASAGADGLIRLWNRPIPPRPLVGHTEPIQAVAFSPNGQVAATAAADGTVRLWNAETGEVVRTLSGHSETVTSLAFDAEGTRLATGGSDTTARLFNVADGEQLASFDHEAPVRAVAVSGDGSHVFSGGADNVIKQFNVADGEVVREFAFHTQAVRGLALRGEMLVSGSADETVRIYNVKNGQLVRTIERDAAVTSIAISADGLRIAVGGDDRDTRVYTAADGELLLTLSGGEQAVSGVAFDRSGEEQGPGRIAASSADGVRVWDADGRLLEVFDSGETAVNAVALSADGTSVLTGPADNSGQIVTVSLAQLLSGHEGAVHSVAYAAEGAQLISGGADHTVRIWRLATDEEDAAGAGEQVAVFQEHTDAVTAVAVAPDGRVVSASRDETVRLWNVAEGTVEAVLPHANPVAAVAAVSPDDEEGDDEQAPQGGLRVVSAAADGIVRVWDADAGQVLERFLGHDGEVLSVAASRRVAASGANSATIVSSGADKSVRLFSVTATRVIVADEEGTSDLAAYGADEAARIATIGVGGVVRVWDAAGNPLSELPLPDVAADAAAPGRVAIRPEGTQLAAARGQRVHVFPLDNENAEEASEPFAIDVPADATALAFSAGEEHAGQLAIGLADGSVSVHDAADGRRREVIATPAAVGDLSFAGPDAAVVFNGAGNEAQIQPLSLVQLISAADGAVTSLAYVADGSHLVIASSEEHIQLWNVAEETPLHRFSLHVPDDGAATEDADQPPTDEDAGHAPFIKLAVSGDGSRLIGSTSRGHVSVWPLAAPDADAETVASLAVFRHAAGVNGVSSNADGSRVASAGEDQLIRVWDTASGRELERFAGHTASALDVVFAADGRTLLSGGADHSLRVWSLSALRVIVAHDGGVHDARFVGDGSQLLSAGDDQLAKLWTVTGEAEREFAGSEGPLWAVDVTADASQVAAAGEDGKLYFWTFADGSLSATIETPAPVTTLRYNPDGQKIVLLGADNHIRAYDPDAEEESDPLLFQVAAPGELRTLALAADPYTILTGQSNGHVSWWRYASPSAIHVLSGHGGAVYSVAFSSDGTRIATAAADGIVRLFNRQTGELEQQLNGHEGAVYGVAFARQPDAAGGETFVSGGVDGTLRIWNLESGETVKTLLPPPPEDAPVVEADDEEPVRRPPPSVYDVAFRSGGDVVASASADGVVRVWNVAAEEIMQSFATPRDPVYGVEFDRRRGILLSLSHSGTISLYDLANGQTLKTMRLPAVAYSARWSPAGTSLVACCADAKAYVLHLSDEGFINEPDQEESADDEDD